MAKVEFQIPPIEKLPVPFDHWGQPLDELNYGQLWMCGAHLLRGLQSYHWHNLRPGDFLCSVLANDLMGAVSRADPMSMALIMQLLWYVHNEMPGTMQGSWQIVDHHSPREPKGVKQS